MSINAKLVFGTDSVEAKLVINCVMGQLLGKRWKCAYHHWLSSRDVETEAVLL